MNMNVVSKPSVAEVNKYLNKLETFEHYVNQGKALDKLLKLLPENKELSDILLKVSAINDFYSTNIFAIHTVAQHILNIKDIDQRLKAGDMTLINEIARVTIQKKEKYFYSFATKYCSNHNPVGFPIYDRFVDKMLYFFYKEYRFIKSKFKRADLRNYEKFYQVLLEFQKEFNLEQFTLRELDHYLWLLGKEIFQE